MYYIAFIVSKETMTELDYSLNIGLMHMHTLNSENVFKCIEVLAIFCCIRLSKYINI